MYSIEAICGVVQGTFLQKGANVWVTELCYDSRKIQFAESALFFALITEHNNGHWFVPEVYKKGVRCFIVQQPVPEALLQGANIILVDDVLAALQKLATFHRNQFAIPVIGITGSNGKTIVKEWLHQLLSDDYTIVRSPKSYNSQLGVPLSVWQMAEQHTLAIFEAGISHTGEMEKLQQIIKPTIGVLTNIGEAHSAGFTSKQQKLEEKLLLFNGVECIIGEAKLLQSVTTSVFTWGYDGYVNVEVSAIEKVDHYTSITVTYKGNAIAFSIPFTDDASVQNAITCCCVLLYLNYTAEAIQTLFKKLHAVDMRLHFMHGINNCSIINDSYSADLTSLQIALEFLQQQTGVQKRTVILSDFVESRKSDAELYQKIAQALTRFQVQKVICIGEHITHFLPQVLGSHIEQQTYLTTEEFIRHFRSSTFVNEVILVKGARKFQFETIVQLFEQKVHQTVLQIDLNAIAYNLKQYQKLLKPKTKIMAMVKAFAYGSGGAEIASVLQYNHVDYLGVAYADEGVELRKAGISVPIMVINADASSFNALVDYNLEPVLYSFSFLKQFEAYLNNQGLSTYPVHLEVETGMNRLGFEVNEMEALAQHLTQSTALKVESVFSHLAASEDAAQDAFTLQQATLLAKASAFLKDHLSYTFIQHIANSAAIMRHPQLQFDMVRLGIGLYGIESSSARIDIQPVATLRSTIAQLKHLQPGDTVSYNRRGQIKEASLIATVRIGYADGYSRRFSNGKGKMMVKGQLVPVIGSVCMDMTMIDVTGVADVKEGDEVIIFGSQLPVQEVAGWIETIPYEIMTSVSQRVKRVYYQQ